MIQYRSDGVRILSLSMPITLTTWHSTSLSTLSESSGAVFRRPIWPVGDCIALDGGLREGDHQTQVVLIHDRKRKALDHFTPADYEQELNGKAFKDRLGEFLISSFPTEDVVGKDDFLLDVLQTVCAQKDVRRVMLIPDTEKEGVYDGIRQVLRYVDDDAKRVTVFTMQPMEGGNFRQEILGYSLMSALGIRSEEIGE